MRGDRDRHRSARRAGATARACTTAATSSTTRTNPGRFPPEPRRRHRRADPGVPRGTPRRLRVRLTRVGRRHLDRRGAARRPASRSRSCCRSTPTSSKQVSVVPAGADWPAAVSIVPGASRVGRARVGLVVHARRRDVRLRGADRNGARTEPRRVPRRTGRAARDLGRRYDGRRRRHRARRRDLARGRTSDARDHAPRHRSERRATPSTRGETNREIGTIVFTDLHGFSRLRDEQFSTYVSEVLARARRRDRQSFRCRSLGEHVGRRDRGRVLRCHGRRRLCARFPRGVAARRSRSDRTPARPRPAYRRARRAGHGDRRSGQSQADVLGSRAARVPRGSNRVHPKARST